MISVIIPVYNCEQYIKECLKSVICQTYRDMHIIVVDDGSTDNSGRIAEEFAQVDKRITIYRQINSGVSVARNAGLDLAMLDESEYIAFVDGDDWIEPKMFEEMVSSANQSGADITVCGYYREFLGKTYPIIPEVGTLSCEEGLVALTKGKIRNVVWNKLWKKALFDNVRFLSGVIYEDVMLLTHLFPKATTVICINKGLYHYRQNKGSISYGTSVSSLMNCWQAAKERYDVFSVIKCFEIIKSELLAQCARTAFKVWSNLTENSRTERKKTRVEIKEIASFVRTNIPLSGFPGWNVNLKIYTFITRRARLINFKISRLIKKIRVVKNNEKLFE